MNNEISLFFSLLNNLSVFIVLIAGYGFLADKLRNYPPHKRQLALGVFFGLVAFGSMHAEIPVAEGVIVDQRNAVVALSGVFGGPISALVSGVMSASYRFYLGGAGSLSGAAGVFLAVAAGILLFRVRERVDTIAKHAVASLAMTLFIFPGFLLVGDLENGWELMKRMAFPYGSAIFIGIFLGSLLLAREDRRQNLVSARKLSEDRFRNLFESSEISIWNEDFSDVLNKLKQLRSQGVHDLRCYLAENEQAAWELAAMVKVLHVNESTLKLFGAANADEFLFKIDKTFGPDAIKVFIDALCAVWDGDRVFRSEAAYRTLSGADISAIISFRIPESEEGFRNIPVNIIDITERKQLEEQIRRSQKMEAMGQLTGGIAHDFNNILNIIIGNLELLQRLVAGNEKALERISRAIEGAERGSNLTRKLLTYSTRTDSDTKIIALNKFVLLLDELLIKSLTVKIQVEHHLDENLWPIEVNAGDLQDAILNIALNAGDAMPDGGHLIIETHNKVLDQEYVKRNPQAKTGEFVMLSISDTGLGMTPEVREKALEPFFTTKHEGRGTGLGLSMVYGFVQRSSGHLKIYSEAGQGTTFRLYFPRARGEYPIEAEATGSIDLLRGRETILVVDDEEQLAEIAVAYLQELDYRTLTAKSAKEALTILGDKQGIDLLFSDVIMPGGMDGYKLALAALDTNPSLKILLASGFTKRHEEANDGHTEIYTRLASGLLIKPYNQRELAGAVRRTLDEWETSH